MPAYHLTLFISVNMGCFFVMFLCIAVWRLYSGDLLWFWKSDITFAVWLFLFYLDVVLPVQKHNALNRQLLRLCEQYEHELRLESDVVRIIEASILSYEIPLVFRAFRSFDMLQAVSLVLGIVVSVYQLRAYMQ